MTRPSEASGTRTWIERLPEGTSVRTVTLASGLGMRVYEAGRGQPVLLLHGFPERAVSWHAQFAALSDRYRIVAPDLRGYGGTDAPWGRWNYTRGHLIGDVVDLIDALDLAPVHLVGHDWGGTLSWDVALDRPDLLRSLAVLNGPPAPLMLRAFRRPRQLRKSWYMFFFQLPFLPELQLGRRPMQTAAGMFRGVASRKDLFDRDTLAPYVELIEQGIHGVNWYRGAVLTPRLGFRRVSVPSLVVFGMEDPALEALTFADPAAYRDWVDELTMCPVEGSGHWVQQEAPDAVNDALVEHWERHASSPAIGQPR